MSEDTRYEVLVLVAIVAVLYVLYINGIVFDSPVKG